MTKPVPAIHDNQTFFHDDVDDKITIAHSQHIPASFISTLKSEKMDSVRTPTGDFYRVASIPVSVVEDLLRKYNFDVMQEPAHQTLKILKRYHLDAFITTDKRI